MKWWPGRADWLTQKLYSQTSCVNTGAMCMLCLSVCLLYACCCSCLLAAGCSGWQAALRHKYHQPSLNQPAPAATCTCTVQHIIRTHIAYGAATGQILKSLHATGSLRTSSHSRTLQRALAAKHFIYLS